MAETIHTCNSCGATLKTGARFCVKCGQPIPDEPLKPPAPPIQVEPPQLPASLIQVEPPPPPAAPSIQVSSVTPAPPPAPSPVPPPVALPTPPILQIPPVPTPPIPAPVSQTSNIPPSVNIQVPPPPAAEEKILCVVGMVSRKTGIFSSIVYHMVVTNERLIFALQTKEMQKQDVVDARDAAKQQGKGFFGQVGAQMSTRSGQKYLSWNPNAIVAENPENFQIPLNQLKVIETYNGDFDENEPDSMVVKTFSDKLNFNITSAHSVRGDLKPFLGSRVK
jgi:hypothetical protein